MCCGVPLPSNLLRAFKMAIVSGMQNKRWRVRGVTGVGTVLLVSTHRRTNATVSTDLQ